MSKQGALLTNEGMDRVGMVLSAVCAVHCLVTPVAVALSPAAFAYLGHSTIHRALFVLVLAIGLLTFVRCYFSHRDLWPVLLGAVGLTILGLGSFHSHTYDLTVALNQDLWEHYGQTLLGSLFLIGAHVRNIRSCRCLSGKGGNCSHP
jgi:hypothetical protein